MNIPASIKKTQALTETSPNGMTFSASLSQEVTTETDTEMEMDTKVGTETGMTFPASLIQVASIKITQALTETSPNGMTFSASLSQEVTTETSPDGMTFSASLTQEVITEVDTEMERDTTVNTAVKIITGNTSNRYILVI